MSSMMIGSNFRSSSYAEDSKDSKDSEDSAVGAVGDTNSAIYCNPKLLSVVVVSIGILFWVTVYSLSAPVKKLLALISICLNALLLIFIGPVIYLCSRKNPNQTNY
jgi:hypothetical protein